MTFTTAVLWDLDGLLSDTERLHFVAYRTTFAELGHDLPATDYRSHWIRQGLGIGDYCTLHGLLTNPDAVRSRKAELYDDLVRREAAPMPGALELIDRLYGEHALAVASSAYRVAVHAVLDKLRIADRFAAVVTGNDVEHVKPAPDLFLLAAAKLGVPPNRCVVLEDAEKGVVAARRAGMAAIAVPTSDTADNDFSLATRVVASLCDVTPAMIREALGCAV